MIARTFLSVLSSLAIAGLVALAADLALAQQRVGESGIGRVPAGGGRGTGSGAGVGGAAGNLIGGRFGSSVPSGAQLRNNIRGEAYGRPTNSFRRGTSGMDRAADRFDRQWFRDREVLPDEVVDNRATRRREFVDDVDRGVNRAADRIDRNREQYVDRTGRSNRGLDNAYDRVTSNRDRFDNQTARRVDDRRRFTFDGTDPNIDFEDRGLDRAADRIDRNRDRFEDRTDRRDSGDRRTSRERDGARGNIPPIRRGVDPNPDDDLEWFPFDGERSSSRSADRSDRNRDDRTASRRERDFDDRNRDDAVQRDRDGARGNIPPIRRGVDPNPDDDLEWFPFEGERSGSRSADRSDRDRTSSRRTRDRDDSNDSEDRTERGLDRAADRIDRNSDRFEERTGRSNRGLDNAGERVSRNRDRNDDRDDSSDRRR